MISSFAPGRICLFGEHQDYHALPVIAAAINLGITFTFKGYREDDIINVDMPDLGTSKKIILKYPLPYNSKRDYLSAALNLFHRESRTVRRGFDCEIRGTLPISAGASSSSAMVVAWVNLLTRLVKWDLDPVAVARMANHAEVTEMGEAGGWMDHVTSSVGEVIFINADFSIKKLNVPQNMHVVLGDSCEKKETVENIRNLRASVEAEIHKIQDRIPGFKINKPEYCNVAFIDENVDAGLNLKAKFPGVYANLRNGVITREALAHLSKENPDLHAIGNLINEHHHYLRDYLGISTATIEKLISTSRDAGAIGCKINGSGFGGAMFALCNGPEIQEEVTNAINGAGGKAYKVMIGPGARINE
ncbi:MAG: mevalonate kinase family protein [Promethearchaeota archaeon]